VKAVEPVHSGDGAPSPSVTCVTVGANDGNWIVPCYQTLLASTCHRLTAIFVDNGSTDGSAETVSTLFPSVEIIRSADNLGASAANNLAIAQARGTSDYVMLLNPDTRTPPDLLTRLVAFMEANPTYGAVGPMQYTYNEAGTGFCALGLNRWSRDALRNGERHEFAHRSPGRPSSAGPREGRAPRTLEHAYVQSSAMMVRTSVLNRTGLLDPAYHTYYEELDLCRRIRWCGFRVALLLDEGIEHVGGGNTSGTAYKTYHMLRNKYYYLWTDPSWRVIPSLLLSWSWIRSDLRRSLFPRSDDPTQATLSACAKAAWWLSRHAFATARRRRELARGFPRASAPIG
jgi:GT2 family glycosyltransferase